MIKELKAQIRELQASIATIQDICIHPEEAVIKVAGANTGNYDPSADCYWYTCTCGLCDKMWTEDQ